MTHYKNTLFIFRRDLRVEDNTALLEAIKLSQKVIPCFIFDPRLSDKSRENFNNHSFQFLLESLGDLKDQLIDIGGKLYLFSGLPEKVISKVQEIVNIDAVFMNYDYTPFSLKRDSNIAKMCNIKNIDLLQFHDNLLNDPGTVLNKQRGPYKVFTPFYKMASKSEVPIPSMLRRDKEEYSHLFYSKNLNLDNFDYTEKLDLTKKNLLSDHGGRKCALSILRSISDLSNYDQERNIPSIKGTSRLSAHNKFGTISIREFYYSVFNELGINHPLIQQLYWRDFFTHLCFEFPEVFKYSFKKHFDNIQWNNDSKLFSHWCSGHTGFPIIDAGMRELNTTGYMHNRVRMIVASFLVKDLHIDWRWGERYFARYLVDYDPCVNNGNWQWAASTGADSQPYFRIFNPWIQQKKFDKDCEYIKKWIPELRTIEPSIIHNLESNINTDIPNYPKSIVQHKREKELTLETFKSIIQNKSI